MPRCINVLLGQQELEATASPWTLECHKSTNQGLELKRDLLHIFVKQLLRACAEEAFKAFLGLRHNIKECSEGVEESVLTSDQVPDIEEKRAQLAEFLERTVRLRRIPETFDCEKASIEEEDDVEACTDDEYRVGDPLSRLEVEDILSVEGRRDPEGRPLGRCLVLLRTGDELGGVWRSGVREGLGTVRGPSLEERGIRSIRGYYQSGQLSGPGHVSLLDGTEFETQFVRSLASGPVVTSFTRTESDLDQDTLRGELVTSGPLIGHYTRGVLSGPVWLSTLGGGWLHGVPDHRGELTGSQVIYIYPDLTNVLWGTFRAGVMVRAVHTVLADIDFRGGVPVARASRVLAGGEVYCHSPSSSTSITASPLLADPYERSWVTVQQSSVPGGGDGLFARRDIPVDTVVSFYHGLVYKPGEEVGENTENTDYMIFLDWNNTDNSHSLDLPPNYWSARSYQASLAHKANHSFQPNSAFVRFYHPRFGLGCLAIKTFKEIRAGEELFVNYRYSPDSAPVWFTEMIESMGS